MLGRQVHQALRVYTTHGTFWLWVVVWFFWHVLLLFAYILTSEGQTLVLIVPINAMLGFEIGQTLAAQFANPRARLLPEFARAHLIAAGGLVTAAVGAVLLIACLLRVPVLGALGLSIVALGLAILVAVNKGPMNYGFWLVLGTMVLLPWVFGLPWFDVLLVDPGLHAALGGIGLLAMVGAASWLVSLCEDSPGYATISSGLDWDADQDQATDQQRSRQAREAAAFSERATLRDALLSMAFRWMPQPGRWRRIMLRQVVHVTPALTALSLQAGIGLLLFWMRWIEDRGELFTAGDRFFLTLAPFVAAFVPSWKSWLIRVEHLAWESLLPANRKDFIREMAFANALEMGVAAAGHCLLLVIAHILPTGQALPMGFLSAWLALIVAQYLVAYSLLFWLGSISPSPGPNGTVVIVWIALSGATSLLLAFTTASPWQAGIVTAVVLAVLVWIGLHRHAMRVWCRIDLDGERLLPRERIPRKRSRPGGRYR